MVGAGALVVGSVAESTVVGWLVEEAVSGTAAVVGGLVGATVGVVGAAASAVEVVMSFAVSVVAGLSVEPASVAKELVGTAVVVNVSGGREEVSVTAATIIRGSVGKTVVGLGCTFFIFFL